MRSASLPLSVASASSSYSGAIRTSTNCSASRARQLGRDLAVERDDAAVGRHGVGGERLLVGLLDRRGDRDAARVCVLDDHAGRQRELPQHGARGVEVVEVVERELLAAEQVDPGEEVAAHARFGVERGALMRVLAVGELPLALEREQQPGRKRLDVGEPGGDRRLVGGGVREGLGRELAAGVELDAACRRARRGSPRSGTPRRRARRRRSSSPRPAGAPGRRCRSSRPRPPRGRSASTSRSGTG